MTSFTAKKPCKATFWCALGTPSFCFIPMLCRLTVRVSTLSDEGERNKIEYECFHSTEGMRSELQFQNRLLLVLFMFPERNRVVIHSSLLFYQEAEHTREANWRRQQFELCRPDRRRLELLKMSHCRTGLLIAVASQWLAESQKQ